MSLKGIPGDTPILCKKDEKLCYLNIEQIATEWHNDECIPGDVKVYTGVSFTPITKIVRSKTWKEILCISTDVGYIEVNKDHPLLAINNEILPAKKYECNQQLLFGDLLSIDNLVTIPGAFVYGLYYYANSFKKTNWYIDHFDLMVLNIVKDEMIKMYPTIDFHIVKNPDNKGYRFEPLCPNDSVKIWAVWDINNLLVADNESRCKFLRGLLNNFSFGSRNRYVYTVKSKKLAAIICYLNAFYYINYNKDNITIVTTDYDHYYGYINSIKVIPSTLRTVYNIECDGDCYQAGIGRCIV